MSPSPTSADMTVRGTSLEAVPSMPVLDKSDGLMCQTYVRMQKTNSKIDLGEYYSQTEKRSTNTYQANHTAGIASSTQTFHQTMVFVF